MKIIFAPDSFKESMSAKEAGLAMERGFKKVYPNLESSVIPMADGGEGTAEALVESMDGKMEKHKVNSLIKEAIDAEIGLINGGETIVIDSASAVGLTLAPREKRNPLNTTSYGLGELILKALDHRPKTIIIGLGGSGTNDGGLGMVMALGGEFLDESGKKIELGAKGLKNLYKINLSGLDKRLKDTKIIGAYDVNNPLTGDRGATKIYGPQKGANEDMVLEIESYMEKFRELILEKFDLDLNKVKGSGAAGGLGAGIYALLSGELKEGISTVIKYSNFEERIKGADLIVTGEGKIDQQTKFGKTPYGIAKVSKKHGIPIIALVGSLEAENDYIYEMEFNSVFSIVKGPDKLENLLLNGKENMESLAENIGRIIRLAENL